MCKLARRAWARRARQISRQAEGSGTFISYYFHKHLKTDKLDVIIFGATGFAGRQTVQEAVNILKNVHWGIAGRNRDKLDETLETIGSKTHTDLSKTPVVIVNAQDYNGLAFMAKQCRIIINCCGPYLDTGENLIRACISSGTHYVDICAEPYFMELMQLKYQEQAKENNVYIIAGCGFQSFPIDIGINFINANSKGTLNYIEAYIELKTTDQKGYSTLGSAVAWESFISAMGTIAEMPNIRKELFKKELPKLEPQADYRGLLHESEFICGVSLPFSFVSLQNIERSQHHFYEENNKRPIQFLSYLVFPTYATAIMFFIWYFLVAILAQIQCTRDILKKYPKIFSFGFFTECGPTEEDMQNVFFRITFNAVGWLGCKRSISNTHNKPYDNNAIVKVCGINPIYGVSAVTLLCSAVTILYEKEKIPGRGGVLTPGAAFAKTSIISELEKYDYGLKFEFNNE